MKPNRDVSPRLSPSPFVPKENRVFGPNVTPNVNTAVHFPIVADDSEKLDLLLACLRRMETNLMGLRQLRDLLKKGPGRYVVDELIAEAEKGIRDIKKKIVQ